MDESSGGWHALKLLVLVLQMREVTLDEGVVVMSVAITEVSTM